MTNVVMSDHVGWVLTEHWGCGLSMLVIELPS